MSPRKKKSVLGSMLDRVGPVLLAFFAGVLLVVLITIGGYLPWDRPDPVEQVEAPSELHELRLKALAIFLQHQTRWNNPNPSLSAGWEGDLDSATSLVQWNARVTDGVESIGLQILAGSEEFIPRRNRLPLQQLTLTIGDDSGTQITTVCVRKPRQVNMLAAF